MKGEEKLTGPFVISCPSEPLPEYRYPKGNQQIMQYKREQLLELSVLKTVPEGPFLFNCDTSRDLQDDLVRCKKTPSVLTLQLKDVPFLDCVVQLL